MQVDIQERTIFRIANLLARRLIGRSALTLATELEDYCLIDAGTAIGISETMLSELPPTAIQFRNDLVQQYFITVEGFCHNLGSDGIPYNTHEWWEKINYVNRERNAPSTKHLQQGGGVNTSTAGGTSNTGTTTLLLGRDITPGLFFAHYRPAGGSWSLLATQLKLMEKYTTATKSSGSGSSTASASSSSSSTQEPDTKRTRTHPSTTNSSSSSSAAAASVYLFPTVFLPSSIDEYLRVYGASDAQISALCQNIVKQVVQQNRERTTKEENTDVTIDSSLTTLAVDTLLPSLINNRRYKEEFTTYLQEIQQYHTQNTPPNSVSNNNNTTVYNDIINRLIISYNHLGNAQIPLCNQIYPKLSLPVYTKYSTGTSSSSSNSNSLPTTITGTTTEEKLLLPVSSLPTGSSGNKGTNGNTGVPPSTAGTNTNTAPKTYSGKPRGRPRVYPNGFAAARASSNAAMAAKVSTVASQRTPGRSTGSTAVNESTPAFGSIFGTAPVGTRPGGGMRGRPPGRPRGRPPASIGYGRGGMVRPVGTGTATTTTTTTSMNPMNPFTTGSTPHSTGVHNSSRSPSSYMDKNSILGGSTASSTTAASSRVQEILNRLQQSSSSSTTGSSTNVSVSTTGLHTFGSSDHSTAPTVPVTDTLLSSSSASFFGGSGSNMVNPPPNNATGMYFYTEGGEDDDEENVEDIEGMYDDDDNDDGGVGGGEEEEGNHGNEEDEYYDDIDNEEGNIEEGEEEGEGVNEEEYTAEDTVLNPLNHDPDGRGILYDGEGNNVQLEHGGGTAGEQEGGEEEEYYEEQEEGEDGEKENIIHGDNGVNDPGDQEMM